MALNPLKFQVAIQDDATRQLSSIEAALNSLKDKTISVKVEGLSDLQNLLSALQHQQVSNLGKDVGNAINEASRNLQKEAQDAVRTSLGNLAQDLVAIKTAIQNDNFTAFSNRIKKCAEAVDTLDAAFKQFHVTIGQNDGMRNFMTGLGEVIKNVRTTMGTLEAGKNGTLGSMANTYARNVERIEDALFRIQKARAKVGNAINSASNAGMDENVINRWRIYLQVLDAYEKKLQNIKRNDEMMHGKGWQTQTFGTTFKHLLSNANDFEKAANAFIRAQEKLSASKGQATQASSQMTAAEQQLARALNQTSESARGQSQVLSDLKSLATQYLGVWGAQGFLRNVIEIGGQLEMQRLSIGAILGDMAKANELFDRIKNLAVKSPFGVVELDSMTKQLSAYGFEYNELFDMTKRLADISAATGTGVDRLALALGHVRSEAALSGYTLRQFSMANIPLARKLSEELTKVEGKFVSVADVRKRVRTKDIGYEQVLKVLKDLTDEGGMFYNAQEIMSESVKARFKNLKDSMDIMYGEIAESSVGGGLKSVAEMLTTLTRHWQELGAVLVTGAGYWAINRLAMLANNKAIVQGNLVLGRFSSAQLEMQATTGNLTRAQLLQAVAAKKLAVADAEAAAAVLGLSRAQLQHVANTGKVSAAMNIATLATSKYTVAQLRTIATMRGMNLGWLATGFIGVKNGLVAATTAAWGFMKAMWPMLAISALVELFVSLKRESEAFAESANYVGQSARQMITDIDNVLKNVAKNDKPLDAESLREAVNAMREVLEQSEFYTAEQQNQVDNAISLSQKYDILLQQLKDMREESEWLANNESLIQKMLSNTGKEVVTGAVTSEGVRRDFGVPFFNDSIIENMDQVAKANSELDAAVSLLAEYQNVMATAIEKNNNFGLSLDGKSWQEQIKMIAESGHWEEFVNSVDNAGSRFKDTAENVKNASDDVRDKWDEVVKDDLKAIMVTMEQYLKTDEEGVKNWAKTNENAVKFMADGIARALKLSEKNIEKFMKFFYELFGLEYRGRATRKDPTEYEKQTDLGKRILGNVIRHNRNNGNNGNGVMTVKDVNDLVGTGEHEKSPSEVVKAIKERAQKDLQTMNDVEKIYGKTSTEYKKAEKDYKKSLNIAESNGISEDEIKTGKLKDKKDSKGKSEDKDARRLREIVKLYKDAYDWYGKYEKQVGEGSALAKVKEQFEPLFKQFEEQFKQKLSLDSIPLYKENLVSLLDEAQKLYESPEHKNSYMVEAIKTIRDAINNVDYEEAQRKMDEYASKVQIELDGLTRAWDVFNNVREATGNIDLAVQLSGADYQAGQTRNLADALREKIEKDFASANAVAIPFDINMSDKDVENKIKAAIPTESEERIKGIVEEYKKWRDLQREVFNDAINNYAKILGSLVDHKSQIEKIEDEYKKEVELLDRLRKGIEYTDPVTGEKKTRKITQEQYDDGVGIARGNADSKERQASTSYINLMNNSLSMTRSEIESAANMQRDYLNRELERGAITAEKYIEEMSKLQNLEREWSDKGFLGLRGGVGAFLSGGNDGLLNYYQSRGKKARQAYANADYKDSPEAQEKLKEAEHYEWLYKSLVELTDGAKKVFTAFQTLQGGVDLVANLFDSLGMEGAATFMSDVSGVLGSGLQGAQSLSALGPWGMAAGAGLGLLSGIFQLHDKAIQREIDALKENVDALQENTDSIRAARERTLGYDFGSLRKAVSEIYSNSIGDAAKKAMQEFYRTNSGRSGYAAELENLKAQRADYLKMYDLENDKKKKSDEALSEYKQKIAELDDQIMYFAEDLAKELWGIDLKGWADQISDSLWTAFENGEDAVKAFHETAKDIISDVAKRMMNIHLIEPAMAKLEEALFGKVGADGKRTGGGAYNMQTGQFNEKETLEILGNFFGENGEFAKVIESAEGFYDMAKRVAGIDFSSDSGSSASNTIKGVTEQTADLLASYINAIRADVSVNRAMIAQYFPMYYQALTSGNESLRGIENHTAAIMRSNEAIERSNRAILDRIDGLRNKTWKVPVA